MYRNDNRPEFVRTTAEAPAQPEPSCEADDPTPPVVLGPEGRERWTKWRDTQLAKLESRLERLKNKQQRQISTCPRCGYRNKTPMPKGGCDWKCPACSRLVQPERSKRLKETKQRILRIQAKIGKVRHYEYRGRQQLKEADHPRKAETIISDRGLPT